MIRAATVDDAQEIAEFYWDIRNDTVPLIHTVLEVKAFISNVLLPRGSSFVWDEDGRILGWADLHDGWLDQLFCRRGSTSIGIGKTLLDFAKSKSPSGLRLYTFQVNEGARRFYAREEFVEVSLGDGTGNEEGQPDVLLEWRLNGTVTHQIPPID